PGLSCVGCACGVGHPTPAIRWSMARPPPGTADLVSAAPGALTSGINATLRPGGAVTGVVSNHAGKPLSAICVLAIPARSQYPAFRFPFGPGGGVTDPMGVYRIGGLAPGSYDLQFRDCGRARYGSQWYGDKPTEQSATAVSVHSGLTTTRISAVMAIGGSISGQVASGPNRPLAQACVVAQDTTT